MIKEAIAKAVEGKDLTGREMQLAFTEIMSGKVSEAQISAFITALRMKGETVEEITSAAKVMRRFAATIDLRKNAKRQEAILDTCGTGGSGKDTFNISTTVAFIVAGAGVKVAKHGNRSASSRCGSADLLESLGVNINLPPKKVRECIDSIGIGFMFAPLFHSAMKYAVPVRRSIGIRTIFNILGPLSNPANATCQVLGVYDKDLTEVMASVLGNLGIKRAFVVHGLEGLDEISISGPTQVSELNNKKVKTYKIRPSKYGIKKADPKYIKGASAKENAKITISLLKGKRGPQRDVVILNASYALVAAARAKEIRGGIKLAKESIDSGAALNKLYELKNFSTKN